MLIARPKVNIGPPIHVVDGIWRLEIIKHYNVAGETEPQVLVDKKWLPWWFLLERARGRGYSRLIIVDNKLRQQGKDPMDRATMVTRFGGK